MPCMTMVGGMVKLFEKAAIFLPREAEWKIFFQFLLVLLLWITLSRTFSRKFFKYWKFGSLEKKKQEFPGISNLLQLIWHWAFRWGQPNYRALEAGGNTFGSIYQVKIGSNAIVAVMDMELAKRLMSSSLFANRLPDSHVLFERSFKKPLGLLFGGGENWTHSREFSTRTLSNLGFGKGYQMEPFIIQELEDTVKKLEGEFNLLSEDKLNEDGVVLCPHGFFHVPTLNILWQLIAGSRFSHEDPELQKLLNYFYKWNRSFNLGATPLYAFPWLRHIPYLTEHDYWVQGHEKFHTFFKKIINSKRQSRRFMENPSDFIDHYLQEMEMELLKNPNKTTSFYSEEQLLTLCTDLFMAGADTTSNSLEFAILFMTLNPEVQKRIQAEIDNVIGPDTIPSLVYKNRMTYTESTTLEILRHGCAIPVTGRCPMKNIQVNDCLVAKNTLMAINIHAIHFSEKMWNDSHSFRPERFLDSSGTKIVNTNKILPFGYGKRKCLGESTSRNTFFLFFVGLLQKYSFHVSPRHGSPVIKDISGLSRAPMPYHILIRKRNASSS